VLKEDNTGSGTGIFEERGWRLDPVYFHDMFRRCDEWFRSGRYPPFVFSTHEASGRREEKAFASVMSIFQDLTSLLVLAGLWAGCFV
jgi:hypothetical protein